MMQTERLKSMKKEHYSKCLKRKKVSTKKYYAKKYGHQEESTTRPLYVNSETQWTAKKELCKK